MAMKDAIGKKLGRNEPCWCNSGEKYKRCHLSREQGRIVSHGEVAHNFEIAMKHEICLHPDAPQDCTNISKAHSLQKARVLNAIQAFNHVYTFLLPIKGRRTPDKISIDKASTFTGFCNHHDNRTFEPLEKTRFFEGTKEQMFLLGYKAICWEYFGRIALIKGLPTILNSDQGRPRDQQVNIQRTTQLQQVGAELAELNIRWLKLLMDDALKAKNYLSFEAYEVVVSILPGCSLVAATGTIFPVQSLNGKKIQTFDRTNPVRLEGLTFGIDVRGNGTASIVFLWPKADTAPRSYIKSVDALDDRQLAEYLVQFFFSYLENLHFAKTWWDSLSTSDQYLLIELMESDITEPHYDLQRSIAPWRVMSRNWL